MIRRHLEPILHDRARSYPVVTLTGPRQSGKTTLVRAAFPSHAYASLEAPDVRTFALTDPRGFLSQFPGAVILDEVQRAPDLLSYIQTYVDQDSAAGRFVLTGSQNLLLLESVSQSLAGRTALLHLLPLTLAEIEGREPMDPKSIADPRARTGPPPQRSLFETLFTGFYPAIHDRDVAPEVWLRDYYQTYLERDVRDLLSVGDLEVFGRFVRLCAGRSGHLLKLSELASDAGISHTTAGRWLSVLEATFLITLLRPHHRNFNKRLIKAPKLFFMDSGLLCYLLRIRSPEDLAIHAARGSVFESFVVAELIKSAHNRGVEPDVYFWRDSSGHEIDVLIERGVDQVPVEIKSGQTVADDFLNGLRYWRRLVGDDRAPGALVYGGLGSYQREGFEVVPWSDL